MPLKYVSDESFVRAVPASSKTHYVIFFSSVVDGRLWCPDCRAVDTLVQESFMGEDTPETFLIYVGDKPTWKSPANPYRGDPWHVKAIPTIIKFEEGREVVRLDDDETLAAELVRVLKK